MIEKKRGGYSMYYVYLPKKIVEALRLRGGDKLEALIKVMDGEAVLVLRKKTEVVS